MTRQELLALASQSGMAMVQRGLSMVTHDDLERFAAMVAAHEREACAKIADDIDDMSGREIADNIRDRGEA